MMRIGGFGRWKAAALMALVVVAASCSSGSAGTSSPSVSGPLSPTIRHSSAAPSAAALPSPGLDFILAQSTAVRFRSSDGVRLSGRLFGSGDTGVVLSHMLQSDQEPWWWMASLLADHGLMALTYDERGTCPGGPVGCSAGTLDPGATDRDILGAIQYLRSRGAQRVIVGGASLGGTASLWVAAKHAASVAGVLTLSAVPFFPPFDITSKVIGQIDAPKLFVAGELDEQAGPYVPQWKRAAAPPVQAVVLPTGTHGTDLFADPDFSARVRTEILGFCERIAGG
jgi:pimeloyl-ACP methyl ester carboxylesterase